MPSSNASTSEEDCGCIEGVLVEIEQEEEEKIKAVEDCLADNKGEEQDLIAWEEIINVGGNVCAFCIMYEPAGGRKDRAVQTEQDSEQ